MIQDTTNSNLEYLQEVPVDDGELNEQGILNVALSFFDMVRGLYVNTQDTSLVQGKTYYTYSSGSYVPVANPDVAYISTYYEKSTEKEVVLFNNYLPLAKVFCCRAYDWTFQMRSVTFEEDDITNVDEYTDISDVESGTYIEQANEKDSEGNTIYKGYKMYKNFKYAFRAPDNLLKIKYVNGKTNFGFALKGNTFYCNSKHPTLDYITSEIESVPTDFGYLIAYRVAMELAPLVAPNGDAMQRASQQFSLTLSLLQNNDAMNFRIENPPQDYMINPDSPYWRGKGITVR